MGQDKNTVKVFMIDAEKEPKLVEKYKLVSFPAIRMFWKGIPLLPPALPKITATTLYRWIKQQIRASVMSNLRETDATTFFENLKEKHPFTIVGLGSKDSLEAKFLNEFSKNPRTTFGMYLIQDKLAKSVFQSIGLSSSNFNVILINNLGKKIKEYTGDLDYLSFWDFLMEQTKALGAVSISGREHYIKDIASTGNPFVLLTLSDKSAKELESTFIKKARTLSNEFNTNVLYGVNSPKLHEAFEYNDAEKTDDCLWLYSDYLNKETKARYKYILPNLEYKTLHETLGRHKHNKQPQRYFFSSAYRAPEISEQFTVLSRDNLQETLATKKDVFLLLYKFCGSNCHDKLKYMLEGLRELPVSARDKIIFAVVNVSTNELPEELSVLSDLSFKYHRGTEAADSWIELPNFSSGYYIAKEVAKYASFPVTVEQELDQELEDLL